MFDNTLSINNVICCVDSEDQTRPEQSRAGPIIIVTSVPYSWRSHLVPVPDTPHLTGNRKGAVTGYDELLENGAMNGNIWYTGCILSSSIYGGYNTTNVYSLSITVI